MCAATGLSPFRSNLIFMICHWLILVLTAALSPSFGELILHDALFRSCATFMCAYQRLILPLHVCLQAPADTLV